MKAGLSQTLRSGWFVAGLHALFWLLVGLALANFGGKPPAFHETAERAARLQDPIPVASLHQLFASQRWPVLVPTNALNPFFTRYFIPAPTPAPPPPTTKKIELTYLGFYQTGNDPQRAIVKLGDAFLIAALGTKLTANLFAAQATMQTLTLTNPAAQTNVLSLNTKKEVEVPIQ